MYTIKTLNAISPVGLAKLPANQFEIDNEAAAPQGILVRSADMHDTPLPDSLLAIARAGAGTNNIPVEDCTNKGIVVFNTPGANANAVAELVVGALVAGSRNLVDAVNWAQTLKGRDTIAKDVEKGKKAFVGPELRGKTLGVIGLGAIGARVANAAVALGMEVLGYDPYISIDAAWSLSRSVQHCVTLGDMLPRCDYLTIHVPYLPTTRHTINAQTLAMCKDGVRVLNFARGELVDNARFRSDLQTQFRQYQATASNAENQMKAMGRCPKEVTNGKYALLWLSLQGNTLCNRETSHLAEMMIQGSSMGITEAVKKLHQYENDVEKDVKKLMERLQEFEEENVEKLKEFL